MNEHSPAAGHMSLPVLLALYLVTGCSEGGVERPVRDVPTFHGTIDLEFGEIEGEDPYSSPGLSRWSRTHAGG